MISMTGEFNLAPEYHNGVWDLASSKSTWLLVVSASRGPLIQNQGHCLICLVRLVVTANQELVAPADLPPTW